MFKKYVLVSHLMDSNDHTTLPNCLAPFVSNNTGFDTKEDAEKLAMSLVKTYGIKVYVVYVELISTHQ